MMPTDLTKPTEEQVLSALLRQKFGLFLRFAFAELGGGRPYQHNWHIDAIEHQLDRVRAGDLKRLIVTMPPRHLKSITVSVAWVAWMLGKDPSLRFLCVSYDEALAHKHASDCLKLMNTDWYRRAFPSTVITRRAVLDFETNAGGGRLSRSTEGGITGRGGDIIIIDDPMKADDALSENARQRISQMLRHTLSQRADDQQRAVFILVMQRLHEADLAGELIEKGGWHELRLAALAIDDELVPLTRGRFHQRRADCALHPARQSREFLRRKREEDSYVFAAQYQQDPVAPVGAFLKAEWFGTYDELPRTGIVVQSWDTAMKTTVRNDWSVGITAIYYQNRYYITDVFRRRVTFNGLLSEVRSSCVRHGVERLLIEDASSGSLLIQRLREEARPGVPWPIAITPMQDKTTRFEAQASKIESGAVVLPRAAPWLAEFMNELMRFPGGRHDDQADALVHMLGHPPPMIQEDDICGPEIIDPDYDGSIAAANRASCYARGIDPDDPWALPRF